MTINDDANVGDVDVDGDDNDEVGDDHCNGQWSLSIFKVSSKPSLLCKNLKGLLKRSKRDFLGCASGF